MKGKVENKPKISPTVPSRVNSAPQKKEVDQQKSSVVVISDRKNIVSKTNENIIDQLPTSIQAPINRSQSSSLLNQQDKKFVPAPKVAQYNIKSEQTDTQKKDSVVKVITKIQVDTIKAKPKTPEVPQKIDLNKPKQVVEEENKYALALIPASENIVAPIIDSVKRSNSLPVANRRIQPSQNPNKAAKILALPPPEPMPQKPSPSRPFDMDRLKLLSQPKQVADLPEDPQVQVAIRKKSVKPPMIPKRKRNKSKKLTEQLSSDQSNGDFKRLKRKGSNASIDNYERLLKHRESRTSAAKQKLTPALAIE